MNTVVFWNKIYSENTTRFPNDDDPVLGAALKHFGDVSGARLLDLGCGDGGSSLFFAKKGANVVSVDISEIAINNLGQFCRENGISNINPIKCSAFEIDRLGKFDFVFGNMILHHLEPFTLFSDVLRASVKDGGKAFFHENNAFSSILIWFRNNVIGKYGIPKYGDDDEFPLMPQEVKMLERNFAVDIIYPELAFFRLASVYLLKGRLYQFMQGIDDYLFKFDSLRKNSYRQYLLLS
ncbi:MAG TPA: methyltransferase domain-containing protein [Leptolyngbyaceae cyanobacterium]